MIIGISGKQGSGKSTLTELLLERLGPGWKRASLGDALKQEVSEVFNIPLDLMYTQEGKNTLVVIPRSVMDRYPKVFKRTTYLVREVLQLWGTDVRRAEDPTYWTRRLTAGGENVIVDDIRFIDEAEFICSEGGWLFRLETFPGYVVPATGAHASETDLDGYPGFDEVFRPEFGKLAEVADTIMSDWFSPTA